MKDFNDFLDWYNENWADREKQLMDEELKRFEEGDSDNQAGTHVFLYQLILRVSTFRLRKYHEWVNS